MVAFDDPAWRSPLTGRTQEQILEDRAKFRASVLYVTDVMKRRYAAEDEELKLMKQLEEEERGNARNKYAVTS